MLKSDLVTLIENRKAFCLMHTIWSHSNTDGAVIFRRVLKYLALLAEEMVWQQGLVEQYFLL